MRSADADATRGWGPDGCRAAVSLSFERLAGGTAEPAIVSPALPAVLQVLGERDLSGTFFVEAEAAEAEPLALTLIFNARNEIGAITEPGPRRLRALEAIAAAGRVARGVSAPELDEPLLAELSEQPDVRYVAAAGEAIAMAGGVVLVPVDRAISAAAFLGPPDEAAGGSPARGPQAWHAATQLAVARAVERRAHVTLTFSPGLVERADALAAFVETLDLVSGLRRAGRLWVPTLEELADWWRSVTPLTSG
jgi:hypothetical protein